MYLTDIVPRPKNKEDKENEEVNPWRLIAVCDSDGCSSLADQIGNLVLKDQRPILSLLEMAARYGPEGLPKNTRKPLDSANGIYEFKKGNFRITWFYEDNKIVVCGNLFRKKGQKTPAQEIQAAIQLRSEYFEAKSSSGIIMVEVESDD